MRRSYVSAYIGLTTTEACMQIQSPAMGADSIACMPMVQSSRSNKRGALLVSNKLLCEMNGFMLQTLESVQ
jgi:hypothetical protein